MYEEILPSAYRHGISEFDIKHAYRNRVRVWILDDRFAMLIGAGEHGQLLEVGVVTEGENQMIGHAMTARTKFLSGRTDA